MRRWTMAMSDQIVVAGLVVGALAAAIPAVSLAANVGGGPLPLA